MRAPPAFAPLAFMLLAFAATPAAAMDCAKATSTVEGIICADPGLVALDERMGELFAKGRDEGQEPQTLRALQYNWLADRNQCRDKACVETHYRQRVDRLQDYIDALNADDRRDVDFIPVAEAKSRCLRYVPAAAPNATVACTVADLVPLGEIGGMRRIYALYAISYRWNGQDIALVAPVILTHNRDDPALLAFDFMITDAPGLAGVAAPRDLAPRHVRHAGREDRLLFRIPTLAGATEIRAYRLTDGAWEPVKPPIR